MRNVVKRQTGITLIALVVTIIVLIILAGVSIAMLVGENGIITQAQRADELTTQAQQKEAIELAVASVQAQGTLELDKTKLETALQSQLGNTTYTLTENGDGSFLLQIAERSYYIDSTGEVITEENMIVVGSAEELKAFRDDVNSGNTYEGKYVYLTGNITLNSSEQWEPIGLYLNDSTTPDDEDNKSFSGIFDGKGYEVNGIYINTTDKVQGLFGLVENGKVTNLGIGENNSITGGNGTAGVIGYLYNNSVVNNCYNKSNIEGVFAGGIVGAANLNTVISNCYNNGNIQGNQNSGGIIGNLDEKSNVISCYNNGIIIVQNYGAGGIAGNTDNSSTIEKCYNTEIAQISGRVQIGGIVGQNNNASIVKLCYNLGSVSGSENNVGGIVGKNYINTKLQDCYNTGTVNGSEGQIGGIIGYNQDSEVSRCYNIGNVTSNNSSNYVGGIAGRTDGNTLVEMNYFENGKVNNGDGYAIDGIEGRTSNEIKLLYNILGGNWKEDTNNINNGYPILSWQ